jgi:hypothetical protein
MGRSPAPGVPATDRRSYCVHPPAQPAGAGPIVGLVPSCSLALGVIELLEGVGRDVE